MTTKSARVKDYMTGSLVTLRPDMDVLDAVEVLLGHGISGAPVVDEQGELIGMLSEFDCLKIALHAGYHGHWGGPVSDYMTTDTETVDADTNLVDLAQRFLDTQYRRFPVMTDHRLVGQISRSDVLRALGRLSKR
jgi:CBS domain-containing protein